jgi:hypothetical protein
MGNSTCVIARAEQGFFSDLDQRTVLSIVPQLRTNNFTVHNAKNESKGILYNS